jgi:antitoxin HicB
MVTYQALFELAAEGGFVITFPDLGCGATQGEDENDGMNEATLFMETVIGEMIKQGTPLPAARKYRGKNYRQVRLPALSGAKAELYRAFQASGIRKAELARRLSISKGNIERLFDLRHSTRMELLDEAFAALGKRLRVEVDEAA